MASTATNNPPIGDIDVSAQIKTDLAALSRVRNRLAASKDADFPRILTGLLPRLFSRLERNEVAASSSAEERLLRAQTRSEITGVLSHAIERIRGDRSMPVPWMEAILPSLELNSAATLTMVLSFLKIAMGRVEGIPLHPLLRALDHVEERSAGAISMVGHDRPNWKGISWLCLDAIALAAGMIPMIDWDMDAFEKPKASEVKWDRNPLVTPEALQVSHENGAGIFNLILDVLLYWPQQGTYGNPNAATGLSSKGIARLNHRCQGDRFWSDMALVWFRHLKLACLRYAVWPIGQGLFREGKEDERALMLCILTASGHSMHGRLAADYLNKVEGYNRLRKEGHIYQTTSSSPCSAALACCLLILVLGDGAAGPVLNKYPDQKHRWESIIGKRPADPTMQRSPLPHAVAEAAVDYIAMHLFESKPLLQADAEMLRLFTDLAVAVQTLEQMDNVWSIQLVFNVYESIGKDVKARTGEPDDWIEAFCHQCQIAALAVLSAVPDEAKSYGSTARAQPDGMAGVPEPFGLRADLNRLLTDHRRGMKRRKLLIDGAIKAREAAYRLVSDLVAPRDIIKRDEHVTLSLDTPILLFKCAAKEEELLRPSVAKAMDSMLGVCKAAIAETHAKGDELLHQIAPLLPSLLQACCAEAVVARLTAARWTKEILNTIDPVAARHLCHCLTDDPDPTVAKVAEETLEAIFVPAGAEPPRITDAVVSFVDSKDENEMAIIKSDLCSMASAVSADFGVSLSSSLTLLYDCGFCTDKVRETISEGFSSRNGHQEGTNELQVGSEDTKTHHSEPFCEICYDDSLDPEDVHSVSCGHTFCRSCWQSFLRAKFEEGSRSILGATCPHHECSRRLGRDVIETVAPNMLEEWYDALTTSLIEKGPNYCVCPGPDCSMVAVSSLPAQQPATATCTHCSAAFCFCCGQEPHQPAFCNDFIEWNALFASSSFWIRKNSKPCPGCKAPIEKNQGCNHMCCSRCGTDFCWVCLNRLDAHLPHNCNRYDPLSEAEDDMQRRALFFSERYDAQLQAEAFARSQARSVKTKAEKVAEKFPFLSEDVESLQNGLDVLVKARGFLKHSFIAAYAMRNDADNRQIFETHQATLEVLTETLSRLTERNLEKMYVEHGPRHMELHFRSIGIHAVSVSNYMQRVLSLARKE